MSTHRRLIRGIAAAGAASLALGAFLLPAVAERAQVAQADPLISAMSAELERSLKALRIDNAPTPYRGGYVTYDTEIYSLEARGGALVRSEVDRRRRAGVDVRVGDYKRDDTNIQFFDGFGAMAPSPAVDDDPGALRRALWMLSDDAYKGALKAYAYKDSYLRERPDEALEADYTKVGPNTVSEPPPELTFDQAQAEALVRALSGAIIEGPNIQREGVQLVVTRLRRRYVDSEGNRTDTGELTARLMMSASALAEDGTEVIDAVDFVAPTAAALPNREALLAQARALRDRVEALRTAPKLEDYDGPVLFEGQAAGQAMRFFLVSNFSGTPGELSPGSGGAPPKNAFSRKRGRPVMPKGWSVVDDPLQVDFQGAALMGHYRVDHEGAMAQRVELIRDGKLVTLLMSRIPSKEQAQSNGHGRAPVGSRIVAHPGNLFVTAPKGLDDKTLRRNLLKLANDEGYDHALIVRRLADEVVFVSGAESAFNLALGAPGDFPRPVQVVRLNADGTETPLRGVRFSHVIARDLRQIAATGRDPIVYHFLSPGAGPNDLFNFSPDPADAVPTSLVTPAFILPHVEVTPAGGETQRPPKVPRP